MFYQLRTSNKLCCLGLTSNIVRNVFSANKIDYRVCILLDFCVQIIIKYRENRKCSAIRKVTAVTVTSKLLQEII